MSGTERTPYHGLVQIRSRSAGVHVFAPSQRQCIPIRQASTRTRVGKEIESGSGALTSQTLGEYKNTQVSLRPQSTNPGKSSGPWYHKVALQVCHEPPPMSHRKRLKTDSKGRQFFRRSGSMPQRRAGSNLLYQPASSFPLPAESCTFRRHEHRSKSTRGDVVLRHSPRVSSPVRLFSGRDHLKRDKTRVVVCSSSAHSPTHSMRTPRTAQCATTLSMSRDRRNASPSCTFVSHTSSSVLPHTSPCNTRHKSITPNAPVWSGASYRRSNTTEPKGIHSAQRILHSLPSGPCCTYLTNPSRSTSSTNLPSDEGKCSKRVSFSSTATWMQRPGFDSTNRVPNQDMWPLVPLPRWISSEWRPSLQGNVPHDSPILREDQDQKGNIHQDSEDSFNGLDHDPLPRGARAPRTPPNELLEERIQRGPRIDYTPMLERECLNVTSHLSRQREHMAWLEDEFEALRSANRIQFQERAWGWSWHDALRQFPLSQIPFLYPMWWEGNIQRVRNETLVVTEALRLRRKLPSTVLSTRLKSDAKRGGKSLTVRPPCGDSVLEEQATLLESYVYRIPTPPAMLPWRGWPVPPYDPETARCGAGLFTNALPPRGSQYDIIQGGDVTLGLQTSRREWVTPSASPHTLISEDQGQVSNTNIKHVLDPPSCVLAPERRMGTVWMVRNCPEYHLTEEECIALDQLVEETGAELCLFGTNGSDCCRVPSSITHHPAHGHSKCHPNCHEEDGIASTQRKPLESFESYPFHTATTYEEVVAQCNSSSRLSWLGTLLSTHMFLTPQQIEILRESRAMLLSHGLNGLVHVASWHLVHLVVDGGLVLQVHRVRAQGVSDPTSMMSNESSVHENSYPRPQTPSLWRQAQELMVEARHRSISVSCQHCVHPDPRARKIEDETDVNGQSRSSSPYSEGQAAFFLKWLNRAKIPHPLIDRSSSKSPRFAFIPFLPRRGIRDSHNKHPLSNSEIDFVSELSRCEVGAKLYLPTFLWATLRDPFATFCCLDGEASATPHKALLHRLRFECERQNGNVWWLVIEIKTHGWDRDPESPLLYTLTSAVEEAQNQETRRERPWFRGPAFCRDYALIKPHTFLVVRRIDPQRRALWTEALSPSAMWQSLHDGEDAFRGSEPINSFQAHPHTVERNDICTSSEPMSAHTVKQLRCELLLRPHTQITPGPITSSEICRAFRVDIVEPFFGRQCAHVARVCTIPFPKIDRCYVAEHEFRALVASWLQSWIAIDHGGCLHGESYTLPQEIGISSWTLDLVVPALVRPHLITKGEEEHGPKVLVDKTSIRVISYAPHSSEAEKNAASSLDDGKGWNEHIQVLHFKEPDITFGDHASLTSIARGVGRLLVSLDVSAIDPSTRMGTFRWSTFANSCRNVRRLSLANNPALVRDETVTAVCAGFPHLTDLDLSESVQLSVTGIVTALMHLKHMRVLRLIGVPNVCDAILAVCSPQTVLEILAVDRGRVSIKAITEVNKRLPRLVIEEH